LRLIWIGMPLVDAVGLVGVIHVPKRIVDRHGFDFVLFANRRRTECAESSNECRRDAAVPSIRQTVLPQIAFAWPRLWCDDREQLTVSLTAVQRDSHRRATFSLLPLKNRGTTEIDQVPIVPVDFEDT
jgi:hypothetical protein